MNAQHITNAVAAMDVAIAHFRSLPYTTSAEFEKNWKVLDALNVSSYALKAQMSRIEVPVQVITELAA